MKKEITPNNIKALEYKDKYLVITKEIAEINGSLRHIGPDPVKVVGKLNLLRVGNKYSHAFKGILCYFDNVKDQFINAITGKQVIPNDLESSIVEL